MKKSCTHTFFAVLMCLMLAVAAGCSTATPAPLTAAPATSAPAAATDAPTAEPPPTAEAKDPFGKYDPMITLTVVRSLDSEVKFEPGNPDKDSLQKNVWETAYETMLGIKLDYIWTADSEQYDPKWNVTIASGALPDFALVDAQIYQELVAGDLVQDMKAAFDDYASPEYKAYLLENDFNYCLSNGRLLGLPLGGNQPDNISELFIRKDWLQAVNMTEPKTIDDVIRVADAFTKAKLGGENTYGLCFSNNLTAGLNAAYCNLAGFFNGCGAYYDTWIKDSSGKLVYGTIQPEMKTALQKLQTMYAGNLINKDFAVKSNDVAMKDIGAGKAGMVYGIFHTPAGCIKDSIVGDPKAVWEVLPLPTLDGSPAKAQASSSVTEFIFVKKGIEHPEAVVKLNNLYIKLVNGEYSKYGTDANGFAFSRYPYTQIGEPWMNLNRYLATVHALKTGDLNSFKNDLQKKTYTNVKTGLDGQRDLLHQSLIFGEFGTYSIVNQFKNENRILIDEDQTLPTATQQAKGLTLRTNLDSTLMNIIMGDDIGTFDSAVTLWQNSGGTEITNEINQWYANNHK